MLNLNRISVRGFKCLASVEELELRPLTVVIGANGSGKTSFLDVFSLLAKSARRGLNDCISDLGGIKSILPRDGKTDTLMVTVEMPIPKGTPLHYALHLESDGMRYECVLEELWGHLKTDSSFKVRYIESVAGTTTYCDDSRERQETVNWEHNPLETALSQVPKVYKELESLRKRLSSLTYYAALGFDTTQNSRVRSPQQMRPADLPGPKGEYLVSCLYYMRETDPDRYESIHDTLKAAFPNFERLTFPPVAAGTLALAWHERGLDSPFYTHELSEGTLRFLWLVTLLQSPGLTGITLIDEPEVSLHPDLLRLLADLMREASERTQLIVATQSETLVRFLEPKEVLICDMEERQTTMTWADNLDLDEWLEDYTLGELWRNGHLGGRP